MIPSTELTREKKLQARKYITVVLSEDRETDLLKYRCYKCGKPVSEGFNEVRAIVQAKIPPQEIKSSKIVGSLCKEDNIMYLFV